MRAKKVPKNVDDFGTFELKVKIGQTFWCYFYKRYQKMQARYQKKNVNGTAVSLGRVRLRAKGTKKFRKVPMFSKKLKFN